MKLDMRKLEKQREFVKINQIWLGMVQCEMGRHLFCESVLVNVGKCFGYWWSMCMDYVSMLFCESQFLGIFVWKQLMMASESSDFNVSGIGWR